jgi:hypothetical protein
MHQVFVDFLKRDSSSVKLDAEVRRWIIIRCPQIFSTTESFSKIEVTELLDMLWRPMVLKEINVSNCLFMRFVDLSPIWPFRGIDSSEFFLSYIAVSVTH